MKLVYLYSVISIKITLGDDILLVLARLPVPVYIERNITLCKNNGRGLPWGQNTVLLCGNGGSMCYIPGILIVQQH